MTRRIDRRAADYAAWERRFSWPVLVAVLLSIPAIVIETGGASPGVATATRAIDWVIWSVFLAEAAALLYLAPNRWEWLRRHPLDVAIVVLTPPILPAALQALRVFRLLRVLRLVRLVVLARRLFTLEGIRYAALIVLVTVLAGGVAFASAENTSDWTGIWWAITTVTTVGYGSPEVTTVAGQVVGVTIMVAGIGFVSLVTGALANRFSAGADQLSRGDEQILRELARLHERLERLEAHAGPRQHQDAAEARASAPGGAQRGTT